MLAALRCAEPPPPAHPPQPPPPTHMHTRTHPGQVRVLSWLWSWGVRNMHVRDRSGNTLIAIACRNGHVPVCQWLLEHGGATQDLLTTPDYHGFTPLCVASWTGVPWQEPVLKWLLFSHGGAAAIASEADHSGLTPLCVACIPALLDESEVNCTLPYRVHTFDAYLPAQTNRQLTRAHARRPLVIAHRADG